MRENPQPQLHEWFVTSPTYSYHEVVLDDGTGPWHEIVDCEQVQARTAREAVSIAVKKWLAEPGGSNWSKGQRADGKSPYTGVRAELVVCERHGVEMPLGFSGDFWCDECRAEAKEQEKS